MWRSLHRFNQRYAGALAFETAELIGGDDHDFFAPVVRDVLGAMTTGAAHELAEASLGLVEEPPTRSARWSRRSRRAVTRSSHIDQITIKTPQSKDVWVLV
jgi:hypothetical protein